MDPLYTQAAKMLKAGGVGVLPTDTTYGLVCDALNVQAVERLYKVKHRAPDKSYIVLVSSIDDIARLGIMLSAEIRTTLTQLWPGPVSVVVPIPLNPELAHLQRGKESLAFRLPHDATLQELLRITGPLAAPSANPEGLPPATTVAQAQAYFGGRVDFYIDGGTLDNPPSSLIRLEKDGSVTLLRAGAMTPALQALIS